MKKKYKQKSVFLKEGHLNINLPPGKAIIRKYFHENEKNLNETYADYNILYILR